MLRSIEIHKFRCFESIELSKCRRINLVVGTNASGKTALLEALYLAAGDGPELVFRIRGWRGQERMSFSSERSSYESIWNDLFHRFNTDEKTRIILKGSQGVNRSLSIFYEKSDLVAPYSDEINDLPAIIKPISFVYEDESGNKYQSSPTITSGGIKIPRVDLPPIGGHLLTSTSSLNHQQYAGYFSALSKQKKHKKVIEVLREVFEFVEDITVETGSDATPMLYASVTNLPEKIPVTLLSSGVNKLLCILLSISRSPSGICLIDEIENGFYYETLESVWSLVFKFASEFDTQVFVTTHSNECLHALVEIMKGKEDEFSLIRTIVSDGSHLVEQFDGTSLLAALKQRGEVR